MLGFRMGELFYELLESTEFKTKVSLISYSYQCFCGNSFGKYGKLDAKKCVCKCSGDRTKSCGCNLSNMVYQLPIIKATSQKKPATSMLRPTSKPVNRTTPALTFSKTFRPATNPQITKTSVSTLSKVSQTISILKIKTSRDSVSPKNTTSALKSKPITTSFASKYSRISINLSGLSFSLAVVNT